MLPENPPLRSPSTMFSLPYNGHRIYSMAEATHSSNTSFSPESEWVDTTVDRHYPQDFNILSGNNGQNGHCQPLNIAPLTGTFSQEWGNVVGLETEDAGINCWLQVQPPAVARSYHVPTADAFFDQRLPALPAVTCHQPIPSTVAFHPIIPPFASLHQPLHPSMSSGQALALPQTHHPEHAATDYLLNAPRIVSPRCQHNEIALRLPTPPTVKSQYTTQGSLSCEESWNCRKRSRVEIDVDDAHSHPLFQQGIAWEMEHEEHYTKGQLAQNQDNTRSEKDHHEEASLAAIPPADSSLSSGLGPSAPKAKRAKSSPPYYCARCDTTVQTRNGWWRHMKGPNHGGQWDIPCIDAACTKMFERKDVRDQHVREVHLGEPRKSRRRIR
ncbi:hypothetical protein EW146_g7951 [Bondarzewia mesenterica]|uniref:C2H2-type domain-containing protein n=1 Tax=Bondarzewia mesenterica TaxID=1095465 RepID=A0A4S4LI38_9AGAM|nr:hypothetical protein EW146_g7951 [Bondarzewia mesenterica]